MLVRRVKKNMAFASCFLEFVSNSNIGILGLLNVLIDYPNRFFL